MAGEQRDYATKIRLFGDARSRGEAFGWLCRMPAQHQRVILERRSSTVPEPEVTRSAIREHG